MVDLQLIWTTLFEIERLKRSQTSIQPSGQRVHGSRVDHLSLLFISTIFFDKQPSRKESEIFKELYQRVVVGVKKICAGSNSFMQGLNEKDVNMIQDGAATLQCS